MFSSYLCYIYIYHYIKFTLAPKIYIFYNIITLVNWPLKHIWDVLRGYRGDYCPGDMCEEGSSQVIIMQGHCRRYHLCPDWLLHLSRMTGFIAVNPCVPYSTH